MPTESAAARLESKVDALVAGVGKQEVALSRLADQLAADQRSNGQLMGFMQQAIDRMESEIAEERSERKRGDERTAATLSRVAYALFTAFLALIGTGLAYVLFSVR